MTLYKGSTKIDSIFKGSTVISKVYKGSTLVYSYLAYPLNTVLFEKNIAGTYQLEVKKGKYEVYCIAGGGGGAVYHLERPYPISSAAAGGSGSGFIGVINITKQTLTLTVGAGGNPDVDGGNSSIGSLVIAYAGKRGIANSSGISGGAGGAQPTINTSIISQTLNSAGNTGGTSRGNYCYGPSIYNNYGAGGTARGDSNSPEKYAGTAGYIKIVYKGN